MKRLAPLVALSFVLPAVSQAQPLGGKQPLIRQLAAEVSAAREHDTVARLVAFGTRHTLSDTRSETRGIGAARRWVASQFADYAKACGGCLTIETPARDFTGPRVPTPTQIMDVLAIQKGTTDPGQVIVISGHIDSLMSDYLDGKSDAPGADDDASGVAAVLEAARVLSGHRFPATIVYAVLSGEEQGLYGGTVLADYAVAQGWRVEADLNNDIIGNSRGQSGVTDNSHVRVFSEGLRSNQTAAQETASRNAGGELDSPSRNIARFMERLSAQYLDDLQVKMVYRPDRFQRGGDHLEMIKQGFPAVRLTESAEDYTHEHQRVRVENGVQYGDLLEHVDFPYLAKVTRLNVITLAALAAAPEPPQAVAQTGAVTPDTVLKWTPVPGAAAYRAWWRDTTEPQWRYSRLVSQGTEVKLTGVNIDDWFFGVSAIGPDGFESPVTYPGVQGGFERLPPIAPPAPFIGAPVKK